MPRTKKEEAEKGDPGRLRIPENMRKVFEDVGRWRQKWSELVFKRRQVCQTRRQMIRTSSESIVTETMQNYALSRCWMDLCWQRGRQIVQRTEMESCAQLLHTRYLQGLAPVVSCEPNATRSDDSEAYLLKVINVNGFLDMRWQRYWDKPNQRSYWLVAMTGFPLDQHLVFVLAFWARIIGDTIIVASRMSSAVPVFIINMGMRRKDISGNMTGPVELHPQKAQVKTRRIVEGVVLCSSPLCAIARSRLFLASFFFFSKSRTWKILSILK